MWCIHTMEYLLSHKKEGNWVICRDVDGPRDCDASEVSQKEKNKYRILMHIWGIQKNGADEPVCKAEIETQMQRTNVWTPREESMWGEGVGGRMNWEIGIDIYTLICIKQITNKNLLYKK